MTEDLPSIIIALLAIFFAVRYFYPSGKIETSNNNPDGTPASGPLRGITAVQLQAVHGMFPHISLSAIAYSLSKTKSVERTSEEVLEKGFLPEPPTDFPVHPYIRSLEPSTSTASASSNAASSNSPELSTTSMTSSKYPSLIQKYNLQASITTQTIGSIIKGKSTPSELERMDPIALSLQQKKERLILTSRRKLLEKLVRDREGKGEGTVGLNTE